VVKKKNTIYAESKNFIHHHRDVSVSGRKQYGANGE